MTPRPLLLGLGLVAALAFAGKRKAAGSALDAVTPGEGEREAELGDRGQRARKKIKRRKPRRRRAKKPTRERQAQRAARPELEEAARGTGDIAPEELDRWREIAEQADADPDIGGSRPRSRTRERWEYWSSL